MTTLSKSFQSAHPIVLALVTSTVATILSHTVREEYAGEAVGLTFLMATYVFCLRDHHHLPPSHYGLRLGGLFELAPLNPREIARDFLRALVIASLIACVILPPFWVGFVYWYQPQQSFDLKQALAAGGSASPLSLMNLSLAHVLVVALPEEAFFRGYLQTALDDRYEPQSSNAKARHLTSLRLSTGLLISSLIFALGHLSTTPQLGRLAVFFPSLLFGLLRQKTGGIGASVLLHAQCNIFAALLGQGYGLY